MRASREKSNLEIFCEILEESLRLEFVHFVVFEGYIFASLLHSFIISLDTPKMKFDIPQRFLMVCEFFKHKKFIFHLKIFSHYVFTLRYLFQGHLLPPIQLILPFPHHPSLIPYQRLPKTLLLYPKGMSTFKLSPIYFPFINIFFRGKLCALGLFPASVLLVRFSVNNLYQLKSIRSISSN